MVSLTPLQHRANPGDDLRRVETALRDAAITDDDFLTEVASHLIPAGGKRLRPAFVVAAALSLDAKGPLSKYRSQQLIADE